MSMPSMDYETLFMHLKDSASCIIHCGQLWEVIQILWLIYYIKSGYLVLFHNFGECIQTLENHFNSVKVWGICLLKSTNLSFIWLLVWVYCGHVWMSVENICLVWYCMAHSLGESLLVFNEFCHSKNSIIIFQLSGCYLYTNICDYLML